MKKCLSALIVSCLLVSVTAEAKLFKRGFRTITVGVIVGANDNGLTCTLSARKHTNSGSMRSKTVSITKRPSEPSDCFSSEEISSFVDSAFKHLFKPF